MKEFQTQIVGFGPAALGIFVAADRVGLLDTLLESGVVLLERARTPAAADAGRFPYVIDSNSASSEFVEQLVRAPRFRSVLESSAGRSLRAAGSTPAPLHIVGALMNDLARHIARSVSSAAASSVQFGARVSRVTFLPDGRMASFADDGRPLAISHNVVLATGAEEDLSPVLEMTGTDPSMVVPSGTLLAGDLSSVEHAIEGGLSTYVIGSSHSAFAALALILKRHGGDLRPGQLGIVHRRVRLYYRSQRDADADGYAYSPDEVFDSGEINKFDGLRGLARETYLQLRTGTDQRARLVPLEAFSPRARRSLYVSATGYAPRNIAVVGSDGRRRAMRSSGHAIAVDESCRILEREGGAIPGLYGLGIGYARRLDAGPARVGINFFHGGDAEAIVTAVSRRTKTVETSPFSKGAYA